ncbi:MAG: hypothetical protein OHK006_04980 [Thermodesulfovibrionales bacterium]
MNRSRIIYRLLAIFLSFALLVLVPYTVTIIMQAQKIIHRQMSEHAGAMQLDPVSVHHDFTARLLDYMVPYVFFVFVLAFMMALFFMRTLLFSLRQLEQGAQALRDGKLDTRLPVVTRDELGTVTMAFNEMADSLMKKTRELSVKNTYINAMLDPLWVVDVDNRVADINPAFTKLFGYTKEEMAGVPVFEYMDEKYAQIMRRRIDEKRDHGLSSTYEVSVRSKDGASIPVLISESPLFEGDRVVGMIGIIKDFREQSRLRQELQRSLSYVETVMDSIEDELVVIDPGYRIVSANRAAAVKSRNRIVGEFCHTALHHSDVPCWAGAHECPAQIVFVTGQTYRATHRHADDTGVCSSYEVVASPVRYQDGSVRYVIELMRDVTEELRRREELDRKNRELEAINSIAGILGRSLKPDDVLGRVLDRLIEMMRMDGGGIFFIDEASRDMTCRYHQGIAEDFVRMIGRVRLGEDIPGRVAVTGSPITSSDITQDSRIERSLMKHSGIRGYCCFPLRGKERTIGVVCLFSFSPHEFTLEEEHIMNSICEMVGIAFENIRLYEKVRELFEFQKQRRSEEHAQLIALSSRLGSATEMGEILSTVLGLVREFYQASFAWLLVPEASGGLVLRAGAPEGHGLSGTVYSSEVSSLEGYALSRMQHVAVGDLRSEGKFFVNPGLAAQFPQSVLCVPLFVGSKPIGAVSLYYRGPRTFREDEIHFLEIIGNMLAVSMERSDYYLRAIMEKELSDTVLNAVADGIVTVDRDGLVISLNRSLERMLGLPLSRAVGMPLREIFLSAGANEEFCTALDGCVRQALGSGSGSAAAEMRTMFGTTLAVSIQSTPIFDIHGRISGVVTLIRDTSREREIDRMKTEIVRSVSHEFRTPLTAIVGMTEMILQGDIGSDRAAEYLTIIRSEGLRLTDMVNKLLNIARIESGREALRLERLDIRNVLQDVRRAFLPLLAERKAKLVFDEHARVQFVADREKIIQILMNLVDNALIFSDDGCIIEVRAASAGGTTSISVSDTGWGIPEADIPRLTERFFRGRHGERTRGTGLGLSLVQEFVDMHGGTVSFESAEGRGTTVTITLPNREEM